MGIKIKLVGIVAAGLLAVPLLGFAPVPNTTVHRGEYLFSEDGSAKVVKVDGHRYNVAWIPTTPVKNVGKVHYPVHGAIAVLNAKGKIVFYRTMSEAKSVNAYGAFTERHRRTYNTLAGLERVVLHDIRSAHDGY